MQEYIDYSIGAEINFPKVDGLYFYDCENCELSVTVADGRLSTVNWNLGWDSEIYNERSTVQFTFSDFDTTVIEITDKLKEVIDQAPKNE